MCHQHMCYLLLFNIYETFSCSDSSYCISKYLCTNVNTVSTLFATAGHSLWNFVGVLRWCAETVGVNTESTPKGCERGFSGLTTKSILGEYSGLLVTSESKREWRQKVKVCGRIWSIAKVTNYYAGLVKWKMRNAMMRIMKQDEFEVKWVIARKVQQDQSPGLVKLLGCNAVLLGVAYPLKARSWSSIQLLKA